MIALRRLKSGAPGFDAQLSALLEGLDWRRVRAAKETPAPALPG